MRRCPRQCYCCFVVCVFFFFAANEMFRIVASHKVQHLKDEPEPHAASLGDVAAAACCDMRRARFPRATPAMPTVGAVLPLLF